MEATVFCALCNSLGSNDGNLIPNTDEGKKNHARIHFTQSRIFDDRLMEDEIFQRCFAIRQPKVEDSALSRTECRQALLHICQSLFKHQPKNTTIVCNLCGFGISMKKEQYMLNHAYAHLEDKVFECRHCDQRLSHDLSILDHIRVVHNISKPTGNEDFEDKTVERLDEISDQINRCFSAAFPRATGLDRKFVIKSGPRNKSQRSVTDLCRSIFIRRSKPSSLECSLCGLRIRLWFGYFQASAMHQHAAAHLEVKLFSCRHCYQPLSNKTAMRKHLRNCHQIIGGTSDDFNDQSERFHSEHMKMIERCFSADEVKPETPSTKDKTMNKKKIVVWSHTTGSKLAVERSLFYNRLIREVTDADGKIKCSLCSKRIVVKFPGSVLSRNPFLHVEMHLQKPMYRCKVCESSFITQANIVHHLRKKHALGMEKNYECVADEFHQEIMDMLSKCYPAEGL